MNELVLVLPGQICKAALIFCVKYVKCAYVTISYKSTGPWNMLLLILDCKRAHKKGLTGHVNSTKALF